MDPEGETRFHSCFGVLCAAPIDSERGSEGGREQWRALYYDANEINEHR